MGKKKHKKKGKNVRWWEDRSFERQQERNIASMLEERLHSHDEPDPARLAAADQASAWLRDRVTGGTSHDRAAQGFGVTAMLLAGFRRRVHARCAHIPDSLDLLSGCPIEPTIVDLTNQLVTCAGECVLLTQFHLESDNRCDICDHPVRDKDYIDVIIRTGPVLWHVNVGAKCCYPAMLAHSHPVEMAS